LVLTFCLAAAAAAAAWNLSGTVPSPPLLPDVPLAMGARGLEDGARLGLLGSPPLPLVALTLPPVAGALPPFPFPAPPFNAATAAWWTLCASDQAASDVGAVRLLAAVPKGQVEEKMLAGAGAAVEDDDDAEEGDVVLEEEEDESVGLKDPEAAMDDEEGLTLKGGCKHQQAEGHMHAFICANEREVE